MSTYSTNNDELEVLKNYWSRYGTLVVSVVLLAVLFILGRSVWEWYQTKKNNEASEKYSLLLDVKENESEKIIAISKELKAGYPNSPYSALASLLLAKQAINNDQSADAEENLRWVITKHSDKPVATIARMRLARFFLIQKQYQKALDVLGSSGDSGNSSNSKILQLKQKEIQGDIYKEMGDYVKSQLAYKQALTFADDEQTEAFLKIKLADLPFTSISAAASEEVMQKKDAIVETKHTHSQNDATEDAQHHKDVTDAAQDVTDNVNGTIDKSTVAEDTQ